MYWLNLLNFFIQQVKILVPNSTAGMIIGKAGNYIKQIKEESGSYVQISQKAKDVSLQERCITVIGEKDNNRNALLMILAKVADDPQSGTCLNVSYADVTGPVANFNPTGSPYAQTPTPTPAYTSTAGMNATGKTNRKKFLWTYDFYIIILVDKVKIAVNSVLQHQPIHVFIHVSSCAFEIA